MIRRHEAGDLIALFNNCFQDSERTCLAHADDEPLYLPAGHGAPHARLLFAHGFFASALHEVAHWCIAGEARRRQVDFGYWYVPDGRTEAQQAAFERAEVAPQALEWIFSRACRFRFRVSLDNLNGDGEDRITAFREAVRARARHYCRTGLPPRAARFRQALNAFYGTPTHLQAADFDAAVDREGRAVA